MHPARPRAKQTDTIQARRRLFEHELPSPSCRFYTSLLLRAFLPERFHGRSESVECCLRLWRFQSGLDARENRKELCKSRRIKEFPNGRPGIGKPNLPVVMAALEVRGDNGSQPL